MREINNEKRRLDDLDKKTDEKVSVLGKEKEEDLTRIYFENVNKLMASLSKIKSPELKESVRRYVLEEFKEIDEENIGSEETQRNFSSGILLWTNRVEERLEKEKGFESDVKEFEHETNKGKIDYKKQVKDLELLKIEAVEYPELIAHIDRIIAETKKAIREENQTTLDLLNRATKALPRYLALKQRLETHNGAMDISAKILTERALSDNLKNELDQEITAINDLIAEFKTLQNKTMFKGDELERLEEEKREILALRDFGEKYFRLSAISPDNIVEDFKRLEAELPQIRTNTTLLIDFNDIKGRVANTLIGQSTLTLEKDVIKRLESILGANMDQYILIVKGEGSISFVYKDEFENLDVAKQIQVQNLMEGFKTKALLKAEAEMLKIESRPHLIAFYKANQAIAKGELSEAKKLYKEFFEKYEVEPGMEEEVLNSQEVLRAKEYLKLIAEQEIAIAEDQLTGIEKSISVYRSYFVDSEAVHDFGTNKRIAKQIINSQRKVLKLAKDLINADNGILTLQGAQAKIMELESVDYEQMESFLMNLGLNYAQARSARSSYGSWDKNGIAFYISGFGNKHESVRQLDAIQTVIEQTGDLSQEEILEKARHYKEIRLYSLSEQMYDLYFKDLYKQTAVGELTLESFTKRVKADEDKMKIMTKKVEEFAKQYEKKEGVEMSEKQKEHLIEEIIKGDWKKDIQLRITQFIKEENEIDIDASDFTTLEGVMAEVEEDEGLDDETWQKKVDKEEAWEEAKKVWLEYNEDILQADRKFYQLLKFTSEEWDRFKEEVPLEIASIILTAGGAGTVGRKVVEKGARKFVLKNLTKLGLQEAFEKGGMKLAMKEFAELSSKQIVDAVGKKGARRLAGTRMRGFLAEAVAFAEFGMVLHALRSKDFSALVDWEEHLKAIGHSILTLGTLRVVNLPLKGLAKIGGQPGRPMPMTIFTSSGVATVADSFALTGQNMALASLSGIPLEEREIAAVWRQNLVLSLGIRVGQGLIGVPARALKKTLTKPSDPTIDKSFLGMSWLGGFSGKDIDNMKDHEVEGLAKLTKGPLDRVLSGLQSKEIKEVKAKIRERKKAIEKEKADILAKIDERYGAIQKEKRSITSIFAARRNKSIKDFLKNKDIRWFKEFMKITEKLTGYTLDEFIAQKGKSYKENIEIFRIIFECERREVRDLVMELENVYGNDIEKAKIVKDKCEELMIDSPHKHADNLRALKEAKNVYGDDLQLFIEVVDSIKELTQKNQSLSGLDRLYKGDINLFRETVKLIGEGKVGIQEISGFDKNLLPTNPKELREMMESVDNFMRQNGLERDFLVFGTHRGYGFMNSKGAFKAALKIAAKLENKTVLYLLEHYHYAMAEAVTEAEPFIKKLLTGEGNLDTNKAIETISIMLKGNASNRALTINFKNLDIKAKDLLASGKKMEDIIGIFTKIATKEEWKDVFGKEKVEDLLKNANRDDKRNAFTHNEYDRVSQFMEFAAEKNLFLGSELEFDILRSYVKSFKLAKSEKIYEYFKQLKLKEMGKIDQLPMEMLNNGIRTVEDLKTKIENMQKSLYSEKPEDIQIQIDSQFEKELFLQATGYNTHKWTRISPDRIISEFKAARSRGKVGETPPGYETETVVAGKVKIKFDQKMIEKEFREIRRDLLEASEVIDKGPGLLAKIKGETLEPLQQKLSNLKNILAKKPNKFIEKQVKEIESMIERIEGLEATQETTGKALESILREILDLQRKEIQKLGLDSVVRKIVLSKIFERNYSPEMINELLTQIEEGISPESITQISNLLDNVVKDHILNIERNNEDGYWGKSTWSKIKKARDKSKTMNIRKLFTETTLQFRDTISKFEIEKVAGAGRTIQVIPDRSIVGEMSGYLANACYTNQYPLLEIRPELTPYKFIDRTDPSNPEFIGSTLVFEVETATGEKAMLIRAFNVPNEKNIDIGSFIEQFIGKLEVVAKKRGIDKILYAGVSGADSNYPLIRQHLSGTYKKPENLVSLKERFDFNGYDVTNDSYIVRNISDTSSK